MIEANWSGDANNEPSMPIQRFGYDEAGRVVEWTYDREEGRLITGSLSWRSTTEVDVSIAWTSQFSEFDDVYEHEITLDEAGRMVETRLLDGDEVIGEMRWERDENGRVVELWYDVWGAPE